MDGITLSKGEFKALSADARRRVIKLLRERRYTLSELANMTGMSSPSMKQHLEMLMGAELVRQIDKGRKWKYYSLTEKGRGIATAHEQQNSVLIVLSISSIALVGVLAMLFSSMALLQVQGQQVVEGLQAKEALAGAAPAAAEPQTVDAEGAGAYAQRAAEERAVAIKAYGVYAYAALAAALACIVVVSAVRLRKARVIIQQKI